MIFGTSRGRTECHALRPKARSARPLSVRLLVQLFGVAAFVGAATGAFYLNGSFTHTSSETGEKVLARRLPTRRGVAWEGWSAHLAILTHAGDLLRHRSDASGLGGFRGVLWRGIHGRSAAVGDDAG